MRVWMPVRLVPAHGVGGGMERMAWTMAEGLARRGHEVTVVTTAHPDGRSTDIDGDGVRVRYVPGTTWRRYQRRWWDASYAELRRCRADVVVSQSAGGLGYLGRARDELGVPGVVVLYGSVRNEVTTAWQGARSARGLYRLARLGVRLPRLLVQWQRAAPHVARWLAVSDEVAAANRQELGIPASRIEVIPTGVDTGRFRPDPAARAATRARLGIGDATPVVAVVSRLEREKGVDIAIEAAGLARRRQPDLQLLVAGVGHDAPRLRRRASAQDQFLGLVGHDDLPAVLAAGDVFVFPSRCAEGRPLSVVEAAAAGLPVVEGTDAAAMAGAVCELLADEAARRRAGEHARARALAEWGTPVMIDAVERALDDVVAASWR